MPPTHPYFWAEVASRVAGRSAAECFSRIFQSVRSPQERPNKKKAAAALQQVRGGFWGAQGDNAQ